MLLSKRVAAVILAAVIFFLGVNIGQLNIVQAAGPSGGFTVAGTRYEGDSYGYSDTIQTPGKIRKITVNGVSQGSAAAEILDGGFAFRLRFSGGSSFTLSGGAVATYDEAVITDCTNDAAYLEVPIDKYVTEILDIRFQGQGTSPETSWEISHPDSNSSIIRFKAENGRYIPHYWYKAVTGIPESRIKNNTYLYTLPYTYTYYVENLSDETKAALSSRVLSSYQLITKNGTVGTDKDDSSNKTLINDDPLKWGGSGWDGVLKLTGINGTKKLGETDVQGNPYWNAVKIYYDPSTPSYDFKIAMQLDRWEFLPVIEYLYQGKQYDYTANVTVEYEDAGLQAYFSAPAEVGVSESFTVVEDSKTPEGTTITGWTWEISTNGGSSWSSLGWGHGAFTHSFGSEGKRLVRLKVKNDAGQESDWYQRSIDVTDSSPNRPPVSAFVVTSPVYEGHQARVKDRSYDPDGEITDVDYDVDARQYDMDIDDDGDGYVTFYVPGEYTVTQEVEDDRGTEDTSSQRVEVLPAPEARIDVSGRLRENRKVILSALKSIERPDDPIDHSRNNWTITPVNPPAGLEYQVVNSGTPGVVWLQSNMACDFDIRLAVHTQGGAADDETVTVSIEPDTPPVAGILVKPQAIRDPEYGSRAQILPVCDTGVQEGDYISSRTWFYKYDTDNDGSFTDESWTVFSTGNNPSPIFEINSRDDVGKYLFRLDVEESWKDEYIPAYVTADDFLTDDNLDVPEADRSVEVLNIPPIFSFTPIRIQKADILLMVDETDRAYMENKEIGLEAQLRNGDIAPIDPVLSTETFVDDTSQVKPLYDHMYNPSVDEHEFMTWYFATDNTFVYETRNPANYPDKHLIGRNFETGGVVFRFSKLEYDYNMKNGFIYVKNLASGTVERIDPDTGSAVCVFEDKFGIGTMHTAQYSDAAVDNFLFIYQKLHSNKTGSIIFTPDNYKAYYLSERAYILDDNGIHVFDADGNKLYTVPITESSPNPSFAEDEDNFYFVRQYSRNLRVTSIRKSDGHINWTYTDPEETYTDNGESYVFDDHMEGRVAVSEDKFTVYVHRFSRGSRKRFSNTYYSSRSTVFGLNRNTGQRLFRRMLTESIHYSKPVQVTREPYIDAVGNAAFAYSFSQYYESFYGGKYDRNGNVLGIIDHGAYSSGLGAGSGYLGDRYFYTSFDRSHNGYFTVYDLYNGCLPVNEIVVPVGITPPLVSNVHFQTKTDTVIFNREYDDIIYTHKFTIGEEGHETLISNSNGFDIVYELLGDDYLLAQRYGYNGLRVIPGETGDDELHHAWGWHDKVYTSADDRYMVIFYRVDYVTFHSFKFSRLLYEAVEKIKNVPQREGATRYITFFAKEEIPYSETHMQLLLQEIYKVNGKVVFFGSNANRAVGEHLADATGGIFMTYTDYNDALAKLDNYIKNRAAAELEDESEIALLLNEEYILEPDCYDYENDTIIDEEWLYDHDPAFFENSLGQAPYHLVPQTGPVTSFQHTGLFKTTARVQDQPKADSRFSDYWLWSLDIDPLFMYVHRRPIADIEIHAQDPQDQLGVNKFKKGAPLALLNNSYDPDAQSQPDKGIVNTKIEYKKVTDTEFTALYNYSTVTLAENGQYVFRVSVDDYYGVWSEPQHIFVDITDQSSSAFSIMATVESEKPDFTPANIPASENLVLKDVTTVCNYPVTKVDVQLYDETAITPVSSLLTLNNPADVSSIAGNTTYWLDKTYAIPLTLPDGNYIMRFVATNNLGHTTSLDVPVRVNTPVTVDAYIDGGKGGGEYKPGDILHLRAYTNAYACGVTVNAFGNGHSMVLLNDNGLTKTWGLDLEVMPAAGNGRTDIIFRAVTANGNAASEVLEISVMALLIEDFQITHMVNHPIHEGKFPISWDSPEVPVQYKAGYYITFSAGVEGDPDTVKLRISYSNFMFSYDEEFDMVKEGYDGEDTIWTLRWYANCDKRKTPKGTIINTRLRAINDGIEFDFNAEESWDGDFIEVYTSAEGDLRIDQVYSD